MHKLVTQTKDRQKAGQSARYSREGRWAVALAYQDGRQNVRWDEMRSALCPAVVGAEKNELQFFDLMNSLLLYLVARATMNHPDAQVEDELGAVVNDHYDEKMGSQAQIQWAALYNVTATTCFLEQGWSSGKKAKVENPEGGGAVEARIGDLEETLIPGHEVYYWPPTATTWESVKTFMHVSVQPTDELEARYSKLRGAGSKTKRQASDWLKGFWTLVSAAMGTSEKGSQSVVPEGMEIVMKCYDVPTDASPGRCYVIVGDELVEDKENPYGFAPLLPLQYGSTPMSPWGEGPAYKMCSSQLAINRLYSKATRRALAKKLNLMGRHNDGTGRDVMDTFKGSTRVTENLEVRQIKVDMNSPLPTIADDPGGVEEFITLAEKHFDLMQQQAGVRGPSLSGGGPDESGLHLQLAQDADQTQTAPYLRAIELFIQERARRRLIIAAYHVPDNEMRLWGPDKGGVVSDLSELRASGPPTVTIESGSATLNSPAAVEEQARKMLIEMPLDGYQQEVFLELLQTGPGLVLGKAIQRAKEKAAKLAEEEEMAGMEVPMEEGMPPEEMGAIPLSAAQQFEAQLGEM